MSCKNKNDTSDSPLAPYEIEDVQYSIIGLYSYTDTTQAQPPLSSSFSSYQIQLALLGPSD